MLLGLDVVVCAVSVVELHIDVVVLVVLSVVAELVDDVVAVGTVVEPLTVDVVLVVSLAHGTATQLSSVALQSHVRCCLQSHCSSMCSAASGLGRTWPHVCGYC